MRNSLVAIIDYGSGNVRSVEKAFQKVITDHDLPFEVTVTADVEQVKNASHIVLPGQGAFADCMRGLCAVPDMVAMLEREVLEAKKPFLGICVGMQLLMERGFEHGEHEGLGWIAGQVVPIRPSDPALKIPHMGWNVVNYPKNPQKKPEHFYFVHSFMVNCKEENVVQGYAIYGDVQIPAIIEKENIMGIQCHPEKSQEAGLQFLHDFLNNEGI